ncbi:MAG: endonuclease III [Actinobacteria bacterium]|nr:endonuclease III [Actinomycetota bacterium]
MRRWRETKAARQARAAEIVRRLHLAFPDAAAELDFQAPFQLLIAVILSAQTTDVAVNKVTPELFARYPTPAALAAAGQAEVEAIVHATGFFRSKARAIRETAAQLVRDFDGEVPRTMEGLLRLRGVARKTANVVLGEAFRLPTGIVVDTHVKRLSQRLGLSVQTDPVKIERDLMAMAPQDEWIFAGIALIWHGRRVCDARRPACERCTLNDVCPSSTTPSRPAESPFRSAPSPPPGSVD